MSSELLRFRCPRFYEQRIHQYFAIDLISEDLEFEADHIVGNWPLVYASQDTLIITENAWDTWWFWGNDDMMESTNIHVFDISEAGETVYSGSESDGTILDQFSISEYEE